MPWNTSEYINRADSMHFLLWLLCQDQGFCPRLFSPPNRFAAVIGSPRKTCQRRTCQLIPLRTHKMQRSVLDNASEYQTKQVHLLMKRESFGDVQNHCQLAKHTILTMARRWFCKPDSRRFERGAELNNCTLNPSGNQTSQWKIPSTLRF